MDGRYRRLLTDNRHDIANDLDILYILDELIAKLAITPVDVEVINSQSNRKDRVRVLLDILIQTGTNDAFETFKDSLRKDHRWLWDKLNGESEQMHNDSFEDSLSRGDVPRLPDHHVRRLDVEHIVAEKMRALARHKEVLVLHGMPGSGKTTLVISVLRHYPDLVNTTFGGQVFWLNLANCKTEDDIIAQQHKLYRKASSLYATNSHMNSTVSMSSIGSNADSHSLSSFEFTRSDPKHKLKILFADQSLKDALLVLDEVNVAKGATAFDIGCKILVITRDMDVVKNFNSEIVKVDNNFTEQETLELVASCLEQNVTEVPRDAVKKLHEMCKGSPFHIALIGAQLAENRERLIDDRSYWKRYLSEEKDFFRLSRSHYNPMKTIEVCIKSLTPDILPLFRQLAILPDNAKISSKVVSKLWNQKVDIVESLMKKLRSKSLIIESYDRDQRNYFYEIHDLIMNYLRKTTSDDEMRRLHVDFLNSYDYGSVTKPPVDIIDDGYIAFYIGYHILSTNNLSNKWQLFNKLFLNLKFLGNKVRLTGPADVKLDLLKYEKRIAEDDLDIDLINSVKAFLSTHGPDLHRYPNTDMVQSVLQHESKGILYTRALEMAETNCAKNELYFEFLHEHNEEEIKPSTIDVKESVTAVCFLGDYAIVGTAKGVIKLFHITTNQMKKQFSVGGGAVRWAGACPAHPPLVAALAHAGAIRVWHVDDIHGEQDAIEEEPEELHNNNYPNNVTILPKRGPFLNCRWANNDEILIAHTAKLVILYSSNGEVLKVIDNPERDILCCVPCDKDSHVILATRNVNCHLEMVDLETKERMLLYDDPEPIMDILTVPGTNKILTLKSTEVLEHQFERITKSYRGNHKPTLCRCSTVIRAGDVREGLQLIAMAVNKAGTLLYVSTTDSRVMCIDLNNNKKVFDLENRRGNVVAMSLSETLSEFAPSSDVLLAGSGGGEQVAKVWYLDAAMGHRGDDNCRARLTMRFAASFCAGSPAPTPAPASASVLPRRHQSFGKHTEVDRRELKKTQSLDRYTLKPLNLNGIANGNCDDGIQPLLAVVDDRDNVQIMRGRKILAEIPSRDDDKVTAVAISPCNQFVLYGLNSGNVNRYTLRTKESKPIMGVNSPVEYLSFVHQNVLMVAGKNRCLMAYRFTRDGWKAEMLQPGTTHLGSQEILNDMDGVGRRRIPSSDCLSKSGSDSSLSSRQRHFPNGDIHSNLCKSSSLIYAFWLPNAGLVTVEHNATIKLWNEDLQLKTVLNGRQMDTNIKCAIFKKNVLVICDDKGVFQMFEVSQNEPVQLHALQEYQLNSRVVSCDLTVDGRVLAMGLSSGDVVLWNVHRRRQLRLLKHHKSKVQCCQFSPAPRRLARTSGASVPAYADADEDQPPLVLVTVGAEIVWWNVTYLISVKNFNLRRHWNVVTPLTSPLQPEAGAGAAGTAFFTDTPACWKAVWRGKTFKEGSKQKEILACIKLSGVTAKKICHDDKFCCFVTVDNQGQIHIMNVMSPLENNLRNMNV